NWTFNGETFRIPNRYYAIYQPNDKWTFICGVAFFPEYEDSVLPVAGFIYKPNDKLVYNITPNRPNITYALSDKTSIFIEGGRLFEEYMVTRESSKNVKLHYVQEHLGCGARFKLNKFTEASVSTGGVFNHYLRYRDSGGKVSIKNGLYTEFRIQMNI
ncbi:MAG: hypothetical protein NTU54_05815, partial [Candidatus Omnitrophica bacterium]|nr:hypothetical protein [Candidatus Omnitrophota bacterium]